MNTPLLSKPEYFVIRAGLAHERAICHDLIASGCLEDKVRDYYENRIQTIDRALVKVDALTSEPIEEAA
jgi:hypothetical protein